MKFSNPFPGMIDEDIIASIPELIRAIRAAIAAEHDAAAQYNAVAEAAMRMDDEAKQDEGDARELIAKVMNAVADEERKHIGEFCRLLSEIDPKEKQLHEIGMAEAEKIIADHKKHESTETSEEESDEHEEGETKKE